MKNINKMDMNAKKKTLIVKQNDMLNSNDKLFSNTNCI